MNQIIKTDSIVIMLATTLLALTSCGKKAQMPVSNDYPTMSVTTRDIILSEHYTASVKGKQNVEIRPQVSGQITRICINEGASIHKGQVLFVIDQVPYQAALETAQATMKSAEAALATARLTAESKRELYDQHIVSDFDLQTANNSLLEAQALLAQAKASVTNARNNLSYTEIKSPVDGVAGMIPYRVGALVNASITTPLTVVSNDDEMYAYFSLTESQAQDMIQAYGSLEKMMQAMPEVRMTLSNGTELKTLGRIDAVSGTVDTKTGAVSMRASFANSEGLLMNGGTAVVSIPHERKGCIVIPQSATYEIQNKRFVYKVVDGKAQSVNIQTYEMQNGTEFVVESGLETGDVIISEGAGLVREGTAVSTK